MKLLLDANISWKLVNPLKSIFDDCAHVDYIGLNVPAEDTDIWSYAHDNGYIIITKDNDFADLLELKGYPPKVVLLKTGNNSTNALKELLKNVKPMIEDLEINNYGLLEIVK
jgi:predicted nuclease of predicted toxin-antitoxin system